MRRSRRCASRPGAACNGREEERDRVADTLAAGGGARRRGDHRSRRRAQHRGRGRSASPQANNVTQIIVGKSTRSRWFEILHGSVVHELVRRSGNISVHVIAGDELARDPIPRKTVRAAEDSAPFDPRPYAVALLAVAAALGVGELIQPLFGIENVDLVFLTVVVGVAVRYGLWPSLFATVVSSLCYNFFFIPPIYTFTITDPTNVAAFVFFTIVAVVVSHFAARGRTRAVAAHERVRTVELLYAFSRKLAGVGTLDDVLWATAYQAALMLKVRVVLLLPEDGSIVVKAGYPPEDLLDDADVAAAKWAWQNNRPAGRGSDTLPGAQTPVPADANRARRHRRHRDRQRQARAAAHARSAAPARRVDRSERARDRARRPGRRPGARQASRRDRSPALRAADLDLARSQDAARRRSRAAGTLRDLSGELTDGEKADLLGDHHRRIGAAQPFHRQSARHDQARIRRGRAERGARTMSARSSAARCAAPARFWRGTTSNWSSRRACRCWRSMRCCSSRCCSTSWTMPRSILPPARTIRIQSWRDGEFGLPAGRWTKATAFRPPTWSASSTSSIARRKAIRCARVPVSGWRSPAVSSKPCTGRLPRQTAPTGPAPHS